MILKKTLTEVFLNYAVLLQSSSNVYRPFIPKRYEDFCGYMRKDKTNIFLTLFYPLLLPYTNINHTCPYEPGVYDVNIPDMPTNAFDLIDLLPSGRDRIDLSYHSSYDGPAYIQINTYLSISDHRVQKF